MAAPTVSAYQETASWSATGAQTIPSVSWVTGDLVVVLSLLANGAGGNVAAPTATGLTFAEVTGSPCGSGASQGVAQIWTATAAGNGSSTIGSMTQGVQWGACCWVFNGHNGAGTPAAGADANKTVSVARAADNSLVCGGITDWEAATVGTFTPAGANERQRSQESSFHSVYAADWPDQGTAGTLSYGFTGGGGTTGPYSKIFVEIKGTGAAPKLVYPGLAPATGTAPPPERLTPAPPAPATGAAPGPTVESGVTTAALYAGTATAITGSWQDTSNATGDTQGTYATWTDSGAGTSATLELASFGAQAAVPAGSTVNSVSCTIRHGETPPALIASVTAQAYPGGSPSGSPQALTVGDGSVHNDTVTFTGLTWADLADLRVRLTVTRT